MKWLFKFFLLIGILFTTGSGRSASTFHTYNSPSFTTADDVSQNQSGLKFTPAQPVRDSRVFQIIEDEEDNLSSRVKKSAPAITIICAFFLGAISLLLIDTEKINRHQPRNYALQPLPRYILIRSIRV